MTVFTGPGRTRRAAVLLAGVPALLWLAAPAVSAHPLGNFTVNRYDGLTVRPDRIDDLAVVDTAEIPTLQARPAIDTDHDGRIGPAEAAAHARAACGTLAAGVAATVRGDASGPPKALRFRLTDSGYRLVRGQAGLDTGRLECRLTSTGADLTRGDAVTLTTGVDSGRIGWHEITVRGDGVRIGSSDVPAVSASHELRAYPADLLANPLDQRTAAFALGAGPGAAAVTATGTGWPSSWYAALDRHLGALTDQDRLTLPVGLLAVLMAMVLGAGHAALPGHGKTIMAAYLAGRQGRPRDAVTVAGTVTLTHTASVLVLGVGLSVSSALVGEDVLAWLGTVSGLVIAAAGAWLLPSALRVFRTGRRAEAAHDHGHGHGHAGHDHPPVRHHHGPALPAQPVPAEPVPAAAGTVAVLDPAAGPAQLPHSHGASEHAHEHDPEHDREHDREHRHDHGHEHSAEPARLPHSHGLFGHGHGHGHGHAHDRGHDHHGGARRKRGGLIGIGIAGGLVPSPSALVVLLGSIALGRTAFGVLLVVCYGLGMAATLALAGLLLLTVRDRFPALGGGRWQALGAWSTRVTPLGTALLILAVGAGTALRALPL